MSKTTITLKLPYEIHQKLLRQIIDDGYGMKGKSKWILESIEGLLAISYFPELVELADGIDNLTDLISVRMSPEVVKRLDEASILVRQHYPMLEGVRSKLIRASILQRLIGNFRSPEIKLSY